MTDPIRSAPPQANGSAAATSLDAARGVATRLRERMRSQILGRDDVIDWVIVLRPPDVTPAIDLLLLDD